MWLKVKNWFLADTQIFAPKMSFQKLFLLFILGSVIGVFYEQIYYALKHYYLVHEWVWARRQGLIYGPFNPLYGVGFVLIVYILHLKQRPFWQNVLLGALIGGILEYIVSFLMELCLQRVSWDYSRKILNLNGRTSIPYMLFWGFASALLYRYAFPKVNQWIERTPYRLGQIITGVLLVFISLNSFISASALFRQAARYQNKKPLTIIGRLCDRYYPDEFLKERYPNLRLVKSKK